LVELGRDRRAPRLLATLSHRIAASPGSAPASRSCSRSAAKPSPWTRSEA
jgi:hypothetical protein